MTDHLLPDDPDGAFDAAMTSLRSHHEGDLRFDHDLLPVTFVFTPEGRLFINVMEAMVMAAETVLFLPRAQEGAMELLLTLERADENAGALIDRWRIYHGEPRDVRWAIADIDMVRWHDLVLDGEAMMSEDFLSTHEPALLRQINGDQDALRVACLNMGIEIESPVAVGIDDKGIDVRAAFGVVRLQFPEPVTSPEMADAAIDRLMEA